LRIFENRELKRISGPGMQNTTGGWKQVCKGSFVIHHIILQRSYQGELDGVNVQHGGDKNCIQDFIRKTCGEKATEAKVGKHH
jgi:hypothetical protein